MIFYTPLCINLNSQYVGNQGLNILNPQSVNYLKITPPQNLTNVVQINQNLNRLYLTNNQVDLLLPPTVGTVVENLYRVEYFQKPVKQKYKGRLLHTEYWGVPLYDKCWLSSFDHYCCCSCGQKNCRKCNPKTSCQPQQITDIYGGLCTSETELTFIPGVLQYSTLNLPGVILIKESYLNDVLLENWVHRNRTLDLTQVAGLPPVVEDDPNTYSLKINYVTPLNLSDLLIQKDKCINNSCFTPHCC